MFAKTHRRSVLRAFLVTLIACAGLTAFEPPAPASADPICQDDGAYALFARGSGSPFDSTQAQAFRGQITQALHNKGFENVEWAELGNLDNRDFNPATEYPAVRIDDWGPLRFVDNALVRSYNISVEIGMKELYRHLNDRYAGNGPRDNGACTNETLILAGYSQGADVVGWALQRPELSQAAKDHIGYIALYGDPKFNPGTLQYRLNHANFQSDWWWVRGDDTGYREINGWPLQDYTVRNTGILGARNPYISDEFKGRFGSWCTYRDGVCSGIWPNGMDVHASSYPSYWIAQSVTEIAYIARRKHDQLNGGGGGGGNYLTLPPTSGAPVRYNTDPNPEEPRRPVIGRVKRTTDHVGTYQLYAATKSAVTEAWWRPGEEVRAKEIIHISQNNIVGFDKVNEPDGTTQSLYTAVPDGVWETWWRPGNGPHHNKIITGLSGVRQVIADPAWEGGQYTHRLYILAADGPYEAWWRDGDQQNPGVHVNRLDIVNNPVTMTKSRGPDGTDQLYVATPTWVFELWWRHDTAVNHSQMIHISQGDIRSLDKGANLPGGGQLLYTGTSTTGWQTHWNGTTGVGISHGTITVGQTNAGQIKKTVTGGVHQLYQTNGCRVQENWWNGPNSGSSTLINISQCNITSFDKSADGPDQQVYTASGDLVYETWWRGGNNASGPNTGVLFKVAR